LLLAFGLASQPAVAQERAPFTGFSVGIQGGLVERKTSDHLIGIPFRERDKDAAYGAFVGYDLPLGPLIAGVQAEIASGADPVVATDGQGTTNSVDPKWGYALSARLGTAVASRVLLYGRAGYAAERTKTVFGGPMILVVTPLPGPKWRGGLQLGAGVEAILAGRLTARAEYRHNRYSGSYSAQQGLVGIAWRF